MPRHFRFRLRTLLLASCMAAMVIGYWARCNSQQQRVEALISIKELGGSWGRIYVHYGERVQWNEELQRYELPVLWTQSWIARKLGRDYVDSPKIIHVQWRRPGDRSEVIRTIQESVSSLPSVSEIWITRWRRDSSSHDATDEDDLIAFREAFPERVVSGPNFATGTLSGQ